MKPFSAETVSKTKCGFIMARLHYKTSNAVKYETLQVSIQERFRVKRSLTQLHEMRLTHARRTTT